VVDEIKFNQKNKLVKIILVIFYCITKKLYYIKVMKNSGVGSQPQIQLILNS